MVSGFKNTIAMVLLEGSWKAEGGSFFTSSQE